MLRRYFVNYQELELSDFSKQFLAAYREANNESLSCRAFLSLMDAMRNGCIIDIIDARFFIEATQCD